MRPRAIYPSCMYTTSARQLKNPVVPTSEKVGLVQRLVDLNLLLAATHRPAALMVPVKPDNKHPASGTQGLWLGH